MEKCFHQAPCAGSKSRSDTPQKLQTIHKTLLAQTAKRFQNFLGNVTAEMTKPGSGRTSFRALRLVPDQSVFCGSRRVWSLPLEARDCSRKCLSEDNAQMPSTKKPGCGKCLLFLSFGEHLRLAGRFTITVQAKGYQLFLHFISA